MGKMDFKEYQFRARRTDQNPGISEKGKEDPRDIKRFEAIPLLGLVGEVGGLLSEYKKMLRDGTAYEQFHDQVAEELGDILWYVATVATKFNLNLEDIAKQNILKAEDRWHPPGEKPPLYDSKCPENQRLPRKFSYSFSHKNFEGVEKLVLTDNITGKQVGAPLTDNAYDDDGYRYHDVMHLAFMACLGWSPVMRKLLRSREVGLIKHRDRETDEAQDGGRAQVIEEGVVAAAYVYAEKHAFLEDLEVIDWQLLRHIKQMTDKVEVKTRTAWEWNETLKAGFKAWRALIKHKGGTIDGDLEAGSLTFKAPS
jgi:NTP pyrophosphatase (non-canonical NTP hydrolase)